MSKMSEVKTLRFSVISSSDLLVVRLPSVPLSGKSVDPGYEG